jgi:type IV secretion system protein VirB8
LIKRRTGESIEKAAARGIDFEVSLADQAKRHERRAWIVAGVASGLVAVLAFGYIYLLPLKEKEPYLVMVDPFSGTSALSRLRDDVMHRTVTSSEAINRSNIARFVIARESYDAAISNLRDWPAVTTMATPDVLEPYLALHASDNTHSPYQVYGKSRAIRIKILSTVLIGAEDGATPIGATVRFQRTMFDKASGASKPLDNKIATMAFIYKPNLRMDDQQRVENPLGFQVTSYRVDNDHGNTVPVATEAPAAMPAPAPRPQETP